MIQLTDRIPEVPVTQLADGDVAIITCWSEAKYLDRVVQRCGNHLISLGAPSANAWLDWFSTGSKTGLYVRILPKGTRLEVV
jgi:hypothetical protein